MCMSVDQVAKGRNKNIFVGIGRIGRREILRHGSSVADHPFEPNYFAIILHFYHNYSTLHINFLLLFLRENFRQKSHFCLIVLRFSQHFRLFLPRVLFTDPKSSKLYRT